MFYRPKRTSWRTVPCQGRAARIQRPQRNRNNTHRTPVGRSVYTCRRAQQTFTQRAQDGSLSGGTRTRLGGARNSKLLRQCRPAPMVPTGCLLNRDGTATSHREVAAASPRLLSPADDAAARRARGARRGEPARVPVRRGAQRPSARAARGHGARAQPLRLRGAGDEGLDLDGAELRVGANRGHHVRLRRRRGRRVGARRRRRRRARRRPHGLAGVRRRTASSDISHQETRRP